jgi:hypothetical protein
LLSTIYAGASPAARGMETAADRPAAYTVPNRATAAFSLCLLGGHHHVEAVGLVDSRQGGVVLTELGPMAGHGSYVCRLERHPSDNGERFCR